MPSVMNLENYSAQEAEALLKGEKLLSPEQVMERLGISWEQLKDLHIGRNRRDLKLPYIKLGHKTVRYRLKDVLELEWKCLS